MNTLRRNIVEPHPGVEPEIGRWLWALQDTRMRTMEELNRLTPAMIDLQPPGEESSIGAILYHLAVIEADWLFVEVLEQAFPEKVVAMFQHPVRDDRGRLTRVQGESLEAHIERLENVRRLLLEVYQGMDLADFRRVRSLPDYDVTPEWVLHHLMQHEAEHRSQIGGLRLRNEHA